MRAVTDGKGVVDGDGRARAGVSYPSVGAVADCLVGLGRITCHGFALRTVRVSQQRGGNSSGILDLVDLCAVKAHNLLTGEEGNILVKLFLYIIFI